MPKSLSKKRILEWGIATDSIPDTAEFQANGELIWSKEDIVIHAWVGKGRDGSLEWYANVGDLKFDEAMREQSGFVIPIRSLESRAIAWPATGSAELTDFLRSGIAAAADFVVDRPDLCRLLAESADVARGNLYAWLPPANYPARLVKALILARDLESPELEKLVMDRLSGPPIAMSHDPDVDILASAKMWAKRFGTVLGIDIRLT